MEQSYMIRGADLPALVERLAMAGEVYGPAREDGVAVFRRVGVGSSDQVVPEVAWDFPKTVVPPKDLFFPHSERFLKFRRKGKALEIETASTLAPLVVFGARPCDMAAIDIVSRVMLEGDFRDETFARRRESITVVAVACEEPGQYCFCSDFGAGPHSSRGSDLMLYPAGDALYATPVTDDGGKAVAAARDLFQRVDLLEVDRARKRLQGCFDERLEERLEERLKEGCEGTHPKGRLRGARIPESAVEAASKKMAADPDLPYWGEASERCMSCGICTFLCPTCYCFSVADRLRGTEGTRSRCWDACMFEGYSKMAGGHNPRPTKLERVRQRFMHKLVYHPQRYGEIACSGCGRCVEKCPAGLHIACVVEDFAASRESRMGGVAGGR